MSDFTQPRIQDDLYLHVNGEWIANHKIPADRAIDGAFHALRDQAEADVRELVEAADADTRIGALYRSFMDTDAIERIGLDALNPDFNRIAVETKEELAHALAQLDREGVSGAAAYFVTKDAGSETARAYLVQAGLGLPDEAYYHQEQHSETLKAYREHIQKMFRLLLAAQDDVTGGDPTSESTTDITQGRTPSEIADIIVEFETKIAEGHWDVVASRDAVKTYNPTAVAELPTGFPFAQWLRDTGVADNTVIVSQPSYLEDFAKLWEETDLEVLQLWAAWHILTSRASYLPDQIYQQHFDFYSRTLSGAEEPRARWKRGVGFVEGAVGEEVGRLYVDKHFPPSYKESMLELVNYLLDAYHQRISQLPWMTPATRERALEKLSLFKAKIGYPEKWIDYSALEVGKNVRADDLLGNLRAAAAFTHDYEVAKLGKPADRDEWHATPQTVNAFYNPVVNDITFPAAILKPPFFDPEGNAAANFGAIGAVIGHEIGHGFDDQGSQFDGHGNLEQWWTDEDRAAFEKLTDKLVEQFEGLVPAGLKELGETGTGVNGKFTLGENIGDLGGLGIAVVAYRRWIADNGAEHGITDEPAAYRELFESWARVWRTAIRPELSRQYLAIDPHSPAEFRCNVIVTDIDEFHDAFDVQPGDGMWRAPEDRVTIW